MDRRQMTKLEILEAQSIHHNKPYMLVADLVKHPRLSEMPKYHGTLEHFAVQLLYLAEEEELTLNEVYSNQTVGVYGGMYVVGVETTRGFFVQGTADSVTKIDAKHYTLIRKL